MCGDWDPTAWRGSCVRADPGRGPAFRVLITARDLEPDPVTGTADPGEPGALPLKRAAGRDRRARSMRRRRWWIHGARSTMPTPERTFHRSPSAPLGLLTLTPTDSADSVFTDHVEGEAAGLTTPTHSPTCRTGNGCSSRYFELGPAQLGAAQRIVPRCPVGRRLWFPARRRRCPRVTSAPARVREATRTVTKPNVSRATGKVRYWEHEALRFAFRRFCRYLGAAACADDRVHHQRSR